MEQNIRAMADLATPMSIRVAATLGLGARAGTLDQLAAETGTSAPLLRRLLDHLISVGVFAEENGHYRPTSLGEQLDEEASQLLLDINNAGGRADLAFVDLLETVTTGKSAYEHRYGTEFWADLEARPRLRSSFDRQMTWRFATQAAQIAENHDWSRYPRIVDLGGGDGNLLATILRQHPGVQGLVLDYGPSVAAAEQRFAEAGLADRATAQPGSFFDPLPEGADAYLLSDILHDWDDEHVRKILTQCRKAAAPHSTVVVIEGAHAPGGNTAIDLFMLMCFGGAERTTDQLAALAAECGFTLRHTERVSDGRMVLEFVPA